MDKMVKLLSIYISIIMSGKENAAPSMEDNIKTILEKISCLPTITTNIGNMQIKLNNIEDTLKNEIQRIETKITKIDEAQDFVSK